MTFQVRSQLWVALLLGALATPALAQRPANSVDRIADQMRVVVRDLQRRETGSPTQDQQKAIVSKLDALISELEKQLQQSSNGQGSSNANPSRPLPDSRIIGGPGGIGDLYAPRPGGKPWAQLPPAERDRILQSMNEGFPPHYRQLLERYYRRLAEEPADAARAPQEAAPSAPADATPPPAKEKGDAAP